MTDPRVQTSLFLGQRRSPVDLSAPQDDQTGLRRSPVMSFAGHVDGTGTLGLDEFATETDTSRRADAIGRAQGAKFRASEQGRQVATGPMVSNGPVESPADPDQEAELSSARRIPLHTARSRTGSLSDSYLRQRSVSDALQLDDTDEVGAGLRARRQSTRNNDSVRVNGSAQEILSNHTSRHLAESATSDPPTSPRTSKSNALPRRRPPVSGETRRDITRNRASSDDSSSSSGSISKDLILAQLAEALRAERRRNQLFEDELLQAEEELDYFTNELAVVQARFSVKFETQNKTVISLSAELEEARQELETAHDLNAEAAEQYLSLLSNRPAMKRKDPIVQAFQPGSLQESPSAAPVATPSKSSKAKRRVDAKVIRSGGDEEVSHNESTVKPSNTIWRRTRKLSKSRTGPVASRERTTKVNPAATASTSSESVPPPPPPKPDAASSPSKTEGSNKSKPPISGMNAADSPSRRRSRTNSLKRGVAGALKVLFPSNAPRSDPSPSTSVYPATPPGESVQEWLYRGRGKDADQSGTYANPFDGQ